MISITNGRLINLLYSECNFVKGDVSQRGLMDEMIPNVIKWGKKKKSLLPVASESYKRKVISFIC